MVIDDFHAPETEFLSNFFPCRVELEGIVYPTAEHAFQSAKTMSKEEKLQIARCKTPALAKRMGKKVKLREGWDGLRLDVMRRVLRAKFSDPHLRELLRATGDAELVEANTWRDFYWGVCGGKGQNWLGKLLMEVRREIS